MHLLLGFMPHKCNFSVSFHYLLNSPKYSILGSVIGRSFSHNGYVSPFCTKSKLLTKKHLLLSPSKLKTKQRANHTTIPKENKEKHLSEHLSFYA